MTDIEKLVSKARVYLKKISDNKYWCMTNEIIALLKGGAISRGINQEMDGGNYLHEVSYEGIIFTNATEKPVRELERYLKNK